MQHGMTALMMACEFGHDTIVEVLLRYGARVDLQDHVSGAWRFF